MSARNEKGSVSALPTIIESLHQQWEAAWEAYTTNDEAHANAPCNADRQKYRLETSMRRLPRRAEALQIAILHQHPQSLRDLLILQTHMESAADVGPGMALATAYADALKRAFSAAMVFLANMPATGEPLTGESGGAIGIIREEWKLDQAKGGDGQ